MKHNNGGSVVPLRSMLRSLFRCFLPAVFSMLLLNGCGGGGGGGNGAPASQQPTSTGASLVVAQLDNAASPVIGVVTDSTGKEKIGLIGTKDASGVPLSVTQALYISASGEVGTLTMGTDGLPESLSDAVGNKFTFTNFTDTTMDVTQFDPAGNIVAGPVTVNVDPTVLAKLRAAAGTLASSSAQGASLIASTFSGISPENWIKLAANVTGMGIGLVSCGITTASLITEVVSAGATSAVTIPLGILAEAMCTSKLVNAAQQITETNVPQNYTFMDEAGNAAANCVTSFSPAQCVSDIALAAVPPIVDALTPPPTVPTGLAVSRIQENQVRLYWYQSTDDATISYRVYRDGSQIADVASVTYSDQNVTPGTQYFYSVMAHDTNGHSSAMSEPLWVTVPVASLFVSSTTPVGGASGALISSPVFATFNETVDASTVNASTFTLTGPSGPVTGTVTYNNATNSAVFTPLESLAYAATYTATVTAGIKDLSGNPLASNYSWSFTTASNIGGGTTSLSFTALSPPSVSTSTAGYQPTLTATGSNFNNVNRVEFALNGAATGGPYVWIKGTASWDPGKITVYSDGSMTLRPVVTQSSDSAGLTTWTVTLTDSTNVSQSRTFTVNYTPSSIAPGNFTLSANAYCNTTSPIAPAVMLSWTASSGVVDYDLYRNGSLSLAASNISGTSFNNDVNISAGETDTYYVVAKNAFGTTQSNTVTVTVPSNICGGGAAPLSFTALSPDSVSTSTVGYQPTLMASGANFSNLTQISFNWSGVTSGSAIWIKGDSNWNNKVVVNSDGSMTLMPVVTQASDPAGLTTWTVTLTDASGATATQTFTVNYAPTATATVVTVANTGGYGLQLRNSASTSGALITTLPDGATMDVIGGPIQADGYTWWNLAGTYGTGWSAVGDWLTPNPRY